VLTEFQELIDTDPVVRMRRQAPRSILDQEPALFACGHAGQ
jgi:hypothetical protein